MLEQAMSEIWQLPAAELAQRIARRQLSSVEVVNAHLARIDAVNPALNAVVRVLADEARAAAIKADQKLASGETIGPLHVPFTVKENIDMAGLPTTWGVPRAGPGGGPGRCAGRRTHARRRCHPDRPHQSA
jgi:amidase